MADAFSGVMLYSSDMQARRGPASYNGRGNGRRSPGVQPAPEQEEKTPQTLRERLVELRRNARATMSGLPRALSLVWETHKGFTVSMALFSVVFGIVPTAQAWV